MREIRNYNNIAVRNLLDNCPCGRLWTLIGKLVHFDLKSVVLKNTIPEHFVKTMPPLN